MREEREDNKSKNLVNRLRIAAYQMPMGYKVAFYFFLAINRNLCYTN